MTSTFPTAIDTFQNPTPTQTLANMGGNGHNQQSTDLNNAVMALEAKVGANSSAVTTSFDYKLQTVPNQAVDTAASQTVTNKTLGSGTIIALGSDGTGDIYYRSASGVLAKVGIGANLQILQSNGSTPVWVANPSAAPGSTTVAGIFQKAATADITAGTTTGSTGALLVIGADAVGAAGANKLVQYDGSGKLPAVDGSQLTNLPAPTAKNGVATVPTSASTQTIAHGLGRTPKILRINASKSTDASSKVGAVLSFGTYNGSTTTTVGQTYVGSSFNSSFIYNFQPFSNTTYIAYLQTSTDTYGCQATVTFDGTNITLVWTAIGTYSTAGNGVFNWEVE